MELPKSNLDQTSRDDHMSKVEWNFENDKLCQVHDTPKEVAFNGDITCISQQYGFTQQEILEISNMFSPAYFNSWDREKEFWTQTSMGHDMNLTEFARDVKDFEFEDGVNYPKSWRLEDESIIRRQCVGSLFGCGYKTVTFGDKRERNDWRRWQRARIMASVHQERMDGWKNGEDEDEPNPRYAEKSIRLVESFNENNKSMESETLSSLTESDVDDCLEPVDFNELGQGGLPFLNLQHPQYQLFDEVMDDSMVNLIRGFASREEYEDYMDLGGPGDEFINPQGKTQKLVFEYTDKVYFVTLKGKIYTQNEPHGGLEGFYCKGGTINGKRSEILLATYFALLEELGYFDMIMEMGKKKREKLGDFLYNTKGIPRSHLWENKNARLYNLNNIFLHRPVVFFRRFWMPQDIPRACPCRFMKMIVKPIKPETGPTAGFFQGIAATINTIIGMIVTNLSDVASVISNLSGKFVQMMSDAFDTFCGLWDVTQEFRSMLNVLFKLAVVIIIATCLKQIYNKLNSLHVVICAVGNFLWGGNVDPEQFDEKDEGINAEGFHSGILVTLGCVMSVITSAQVSMTSLAGAFNLANASRDFFSFLYDNMREFFGHAMYYVTKDESWLWMPLAKKVVLYVQEVDAWLKINPEWEYAIRGSSASLKQQIKQLIDDYDKILLELCDSSQSVGHLVTALKQHEKIILLMKKQLKLVSGIAMRNEPAVIFFYGKADAGKNTTLPLLCKTVYRILRRKGYQYRGMDLPEWAPECMWSKADDTDYYNGYKNNFVYNIEEFCKVKTIADRQKECSALLKLICKESLPVNTAFEDKGEMFHTSPLVTITTNFDDFGNTGLTDVNAMIRRFHFPIKVSRVGDATDFLQMDKIKLDDVDLYWKFEVIAQTPNATILQPKIRPGVYKFYDLAAEIADFIVQKAKVKRTDNFEFDLPPETSSSSTTSTSYSEDTSSDHGGGIGEFLASFDDDDPKGKKKDKSATGKDMNQKLMTNYKRVNTAGLQARELSLAMTKRAICEDRPYMYNKVASTLTHKPLSEEYFTLYKDGELYPGKYSSVVWASGDQKLEPDMALGAVQSAAGIKFVLYDSKSGIVDNSYRLLHGEKWDRLTTRERVRERMMCRSILVPGVKPEFFEGLLMMAASGAVSVLSYKYGPKVTKWGVNAILRQMKGSTFDDVWEHHKVNPRSWVKLSFEDFCDLIEYTYCIGQLPWFCQYIIAEMRDDTYNFAPEAQERVTKIMNIAVEKKMASWPLILFATKINFNDLSRQMRTCCTWDEPFKQAAAERRMMGVEDAINYLFVDYYAVTAQITYEEFKRREAIWYDRPSALIEHRSGSMRMCTQLLSGLVAASGVILGLHMLKSTLTYLFGGFELTPQSNTHKLGTKMPKKKIRRKQKKAAQNIDEDAYIEGQGATQYAEEYLGIRPFLRYVVLKGEECDLGTWATVSGYSLFINKHTLMRCGQIHTVHIKDDAGKKNVSDAFVKRTTVLQNRDGVRLDLDPRCVTAFPSIKKYLRKKGNPFKGVAGRVRLVVKPDKNSEFKVSVFVEEGDSLCYYANRPKMVKAQPSEFFVKEYYILKNAQGCPGDCGQPYMAHRSEKQRVIGIHFGSWGEDSYVVPLWQEDLDENEPSHLVAGALGEVILSQAAESRCFERHQNVGHLVNPVYMNTESQFVPSPVCQELKDRGRVTVAPAKLTFFKDEKGEMIDPWTNAFEKVAFETPVEDYSVFEDMMENPDHYYEDYGEPRKPVKQLDLETALFGRTAEEGIPIQAADRSTSSTYDYKSKGIKKESLWGLDPKGNRFIDERLKNDLKVIEEAAADGVDIINTAEAALKDETLPMEKVKVGKTRLFCVSSLLVCLFIKMQIGELFSELKTHLSDTVSQVGINPHGFPWEWLYDAISQYDGDILNGDFSRWDGSIKKCMTWVFFKYCNKYYGYAPKTREYNMLYAACRACVGYYLIYGKRVFLLDFSVCSGGWATSIINTFINHCFHRAGYLWLAFDYTKEMSWKRWMVMRFYGDDSIGRVAKEISHLINMKTLAEFFRKYLGLVYTSADKGIAGEKPVTMDDMTFLARRFRCEMRLGTRLVFAPLEEESIYGMLAYIRRPKDEDVSIRDQFLINLEVAFSEMFHHGEERYNEFLNEMRDVCKYMGGVSYPQYSDYYDRWIGQTQQFN